MKNLQTLIIENVQFKYPEQDLVFLKKVESSLSRLSLANSFPKMNMETITCFNFLKMENLDELNLKNVGLINILKIDKFFPNLTILDLTKNRIF